MGEKRSEDRKGTGRERMSRTRWGGAEAVDAMVVVFVWLLRRSLLGTPAPDPWASQRSRRTGDEVCSRAGRKWETWSLSLRSGLVLGIGSVIGEGRAKGYFRPALKVIFVVVCTVQCPLKFNAP